LSAEAITPAKENDIRKLFVLMGNSSIAEEMANSMVSIAIAQEKKRYPNLPKNVEHALSQAIYDVAMENAPELDALMVPLYDKYYTHQEIKDLIVFFETPAGKKYASVLTPMMQEIVPIAQTWGNKIGPIAAKRAEKELAKYGYK
jgi:hypothetical protein